jgi:Domain of unknown function (DUF4267)
MTVAPKLARTLSWDGPLAWIVALAALALLAIGIRAMLAPSAAAAGFGMPLGGAEGLIYVQAFGARNIGLSLFALVMIALDQRRPLGVLFVCAALIAVLDGLILATYLGFGPGLVRHGAIAAVLVLLGVLQLRAT